MPPMRRSRRTTRPARWSARRRPAEGQRRTRQEGRRDRRGVNPIRRRGRGRRRRRHHHDGRGRRRARKSGAGARAGRRLRCAHERRADGGTRSGAARAKRSKPAWTTAGDNVQTEARRKTERGQAAVTYSHTRRGNVRPRPCRRPAAGAGDPTHRGFRLTSSANNDYHRRRSNPSISSANDSVRITQEVGRRIVGHEEIVNRTVTSLLAGGHVLLEGIPGVGKTRLVHTLADVLHLKFSRIQFTPDLMPADIVGTNIVQEHSHGGTFFEFQPGTDLRQRRARRRDQPRDAEDAVGAARGDAGRQRLGRQDAPTSSSSRSSCSRRRTRSRWKARIRCPRRSSIGSSSS